MKKVFYTTEFFDKCPLCGGKISTYPNYMKGHGLYDTTECSSCSYVEISSLEVASAKVAEGEFGLVVEIVKI